MIFLNNFKLLKKTKKSVPVNNLCLLLKFLAFFQQSHSTVSFAWI
jgi:hypothetical protein